MYWLVHGNPNIENYVNLQQVYFPVCLSYIVENQFYMVYIFRMLLLHEGGLIVLPPLK